LQKWVFTNGNAIEQVVKDGKTYFAICDYETLRSLFATLLSEVQRIKSEGDYGAGKALVEQYAIKNRSTAACRSTETICCFRIKTNTEVS